MKLPCVGKIAGLNQPVSRLFFGTAIPPVMADEPGTMDLLDSVLDTGVNAFDCARSYGRAEEVLGHWMEDRGCRNRITLLSKCGDIQAGIVRVNRQVILEQLSRSLDALRTDCIDIYLLHRDDPDTPLEEYIETLNEIKESGRIRVFGVSNWTAERIAAANQVAASLGLSGFSVSSPNYSLAVQMQDPFGGGCVTLSGSENRAARSWYAENQMPVIAYSCLARGFLSGRFRSGEFEKARHLLDIFAQKGFLYEENMERLARAEQLAGRLGISVPEVGMRYLFSTKMNLFAVVSTVSAERLKGNLEAVAHPLTAEEVSFLEGEDGCR